ncbi:MAG: CBS domain-containing protein, partial [Bacteroidota bacterium]
RFPQLLTKHIAEDSVADFNEGKAPALRALRIHNGTVYNWNRPCYGRAGGVAHLRIENRYVPSGPTQKDEIANLAFWVGLMEGMPEQYDHFYEWTSFDDAKDNFYRAARTGLHTCFKWFGQTITAQRLILETLLPMAEAGLRKFNVQEEEIKKYLSIIEQRAMTQQTGAQWQLHNFSQIRKSYGADASLKYLTRAMHELQKEDMCVHEWPRDISMKSFRGMTAEKSISQIMTTDLFTVRAEESIDLVSALMDWHSIRHLPVEGVDGSLKGIITAKDVAKLEQSEKMKVVSDVMSKNLITVGRNCKVSEAIRLMKTNDIGCLPVVSEQRIIGMITDTDLRNVGLW